ncbi:KN motif and ankyrin repeat domain-containing protein 2-like [Clarias gariepinus]|uniref:KN motif and ankyrin repeat domain-containing protein 2-like n=1 Tax=Clarias gariepinus TaxID=13013 RepID=UPI00234CECDD|nr:KN motif and ankyrin repeat domain-containing protein 2-like [Clarias gariepinus]XP_053358661.1 KN motif and ankyrin repeat domain-containing protein 2-like [Clarias gariepinus]
MDNQKVNGVAPKENRRQPSYSVETPYGFHLDLDFVKYVEDIEKGNTLRRVQLQRRPRVRSSGNLARNLSLPGYSCRSSQWNSASILFPRTRLADSQHPGDGESAGYSRQSESPYKFSKAFDEQPLGPHVRPNLLRASSLPLTVLLRKYSNEDPTSPNGSRDFLSQENGSIEDVFHSPGGVNGTIQQLTAALQRVGELEEEIRIIPELRAQICILQEEHERLLHTFQSEPDNAVLQDFSSVVKVREKKNQMKDDWMDREYDQLEENIKASSQQVNAIAMTTEKHSQVTKKNHEDAEESLIEALQKKITALEQKLHELDSDLEKTTILLKQQKQESRFKDERINELTKQHAESIWVRPDNLRNLENKESPQMSSPEPEASKAFQVCLEQDFKPGTSAEAAGSQADMEHHVKKVRELLQEQWECLCRNEGSGKDMSSKHLHPRVCFIQTQLVSLANLLTLYVSPSGGAPPSAQESMMEDQLSVVETWECPEEDQGRDRDSGEGVESSTRAEDPAEEGFNQNIFLTEVELPSSTLSNRKTSAETRDSKMAEEHHEQQDRKCEAKCPGGQAEDKQDGMCSGSEPEEAPRGDSGRGVESDFMNACHFLEKHMNEVSEPNDEMRRALTMVFQQWFHVCAEENSCANTAALYVNEVASKTPAVLQFLVNMVDDNGNTALHYSVSHSKFSIVKLLLDTGVCDVDLKNKTGYTAIMLASLQSVDTDTDIKVVQQLMELGDVNARAGQVGQTALHLAVRHGRASMLRLLLANGANVNAQDQAGTTALISACDRGHADIVRILLEDPDCDVNLTDKGSRSALSLATQASHTEIADLLKARTANTKANDKCKMA